VTVDFAPSSENQFNLTEPQEDEYLPTTGLLTSTDTVPEPGTDFDSDGDSDFIWYNTADGQVVLWTMNNLAFQTNKFIGQMPLDWQLVGPSDVNNDGNADLLWFNTQNQEVYSWIIQDGAFQSAVYLGTGPGGWQPLGVGDLKQNGQNDLLWKDTSTGTVYLWELAGTTVTEVTPVVVAPSADWGWPQLGILMVIHWSIWCGKTTPVGRSISDPNQCFYLRLECYLSAWYPSRCKLENHRQWRF
jgi:hypothetical protein